MKAAEALNSIIKERGVTYTSLSRKTGISVDALSRSMMGKRTLQADEMLKLCVVLGVDLPDLRQAAPCDV